MKYFIIDTLIFILVFNLTLFYLDDFKLSDTTLKYSVDSTDITSDQKIAYENIIEDFYTFFKKPTNNDNIVSNNNNIQNPLGGGSEPLDNPLKDLVLGIDMITFACFSLVFILTFILIFKYLLDEDKTKFKLA